MTIRGYESGDCADMARLFYDTVHTVNAKDYSEEQLNVWATGKVDLEAWDRSFMEHHTFVAVSDGEIIGFADIDDTGYLDRLYIHKDHQGEGVGTALCDKAETMVNAGKVTTHASITAKPFFEKRGYKVIREQQVERQGILLTNYVMEKEPNVSAPEKSCLQAIEKRRSIRKYKQDPIPRALIEEILRAGTLAPSSKNRQPWKFIVAAGEAKAEALQAMERGIEREKQNPLLPKSARFIKGAEYTLSIMRQVPVVIFIINILGADIHDRLDEEARIYEICNAQSVGAAIENMTLAATELGLGSLWICDTYFAYEELCGWLGEEGELYAAFAVGYADEAPHARPRKAMDAAVIWRE